MQLKLKNYKVWTSTMEYEQFYGHKNVLIKKLKNIHCTCSVLRKSNITKHYKNIS